MKNARLYKQYLFRVSILLLLLNSACSHLPTQPTEKPLFTVASVACSEAWINLSTSGILGPATLTLAADAKPLKTYSVGSRDTVLHLDSLLPGTSYTLGGSFRTSGSMATIRQDFRTMDTTSHEWKFDICFLDGEGDNEIRDVAIINDTLAYAVGTIYMTDTNGTVDRVPYCLAKWNGKAWTLRKLFYKSYADQGKEVINAISEAQGIYACNENDIWIAAGSILHWNGRDSITDLSLASMPFNENGAFINKIWGVSSSDFYGVGHEGAIVHYKNGSWTRLASGVTGDFWDIWGSPDGSEILAGGRDLSSSSMNRLVSIKGSTVTPILEDTIFEIFSLWFIPGKVYYLGGEGLAIKHLLDNKHWVEKNLTKSPSFGVRGTDINDVFVTGGDFELLHYNGMSWRNYNIPLNSVGALGSLSIRGNLVMISGYAGNRAIVVVGRRN